MKCVTVLLLLVLSMSLVAADVVQQSTVPSDPALFKLELDNAQFRFYSNHDINEPNYLIKRLVLVIQGNKRDAASRMNIMQKILDELGVSNETLVISPCYKIIEDNPSSDEPYWKNAGWKQGDRSKDKSRISSFQVIDELIKRVVISGYFPMLDQVVVSGHSAGGQVTHRYALTSMIVLQFPKVRFSFMVMNPSSYTYLNAERPVEIDLVTSLPPHYDDYKYGLNKRNAYSSLRTNKQLRKAYLNRHVFYLLGQEDCDPCAEDLDLREEAMLQGEHRLSRGRNYFRHIQMLSNHHKHQLFEVADTGHDAEGMYRSAAARCIMFQ